MSIFQSVSIDLKKYQNVDTRTKDLINAYIRNMQSLFPSNIPYYTIPMNINYILTIFYFFNFKELAQELSDQPTQLLEIANNNNVFKELAKHCIAKQDENLWRIVLSEENKHRKSLINHVIIHLPHLNNKADEVSCGVKAFMHADLPHALIELLEAIMSKSNFANNKNLQNLLILTAIKCEPSKVSGYVESLDNYDGLDLGVICCADTYKLYEEAFLIYKKFEFGVKAINVLLQHLSDMDRAKQFASDYNKSEVWTILGKALLDNELIKECIELFAKHKDITYYKEVIALVNKYNSIELYVELIEYLNTAQCVAKTDKDKRIIDFELLYCLAKTDNVIKFELFLATQDSLNGYMMMKVGDRLFDDKLFNFAKTIFTKVSHYAKLNACNEALENNDVIP